MSSLTNPGRFILSRTTGGQRPTFDKRTGVLFRIAQAVTHPAQH